MCDLGAWLKQLSNFQKIISIGIPISSVNHWAGVIHLSKPLRRSGLERENFSGLQIELFPVKFYCPKHSPKSLFIHFFHQPCVKDGGFDSLLKFSILNVVYDGLRLLYVLSLCEACVYVGHYVPS